MKKVLLLSLAAFISFQAGQAMAEPSCSKTSSDRHASTKVKKQKATAVASVARPANQSRRVR